MGKAPADQFYWGDWLRDVELQMACSATRGIWMNTLAHMWFAEERGELVGTKEKLARFLNATDKDFAGFLKEAEALHFCYVSRSDNGYVTLRNRRMYKAEKKRITNRLRQQRHRERYESNTDVTLPSSSSPSNLENLELLKEQDLLVSSPSGDGVENENEVYQTKKKRILKGQKLEWFLEFWKVFDYKTGKADAADAWLDIKGLNDNLFQSILAGAKQEALRRPDIVACGKIPKMGQGWLSGKRWEDSYGSTSKGYKFR